MKILAADYVLPISSEPIENGAVIIDEDRLAYVGSRSSIPEEFSSLEVDDLGRSAILPGFVNCHSHLELTALRGALDSVEHDFKRWLMTLNEMRAAMSESDIIESAVAGALEGASAGVTCFGDIGRFGNAGLTALKRYGLRGIVYQETEFSPDNRTADDDFAALAKKFEALHAEQIDLVRVGLSPHAPYTVGSRLFELIAQYSIINRVPISIHAAESANEVELLTKGTGFFSEVYEKFDIEWSSPFCTPIEYLERLGVLSAQPLLAHCILVSDSDIARIAGNGAKVAHCPRSNAKFGHGYAPLEKMLDAGIAVGFGSDSAASNNVCDILEEARFGTLVARNRDESDRFISAKEALETATLGGAKALGLDSSIGTLEAGKQADIAVISLFDPRQLPINDIEAALVFSSTGRDVIRTIVAGKTVYELTSID